ncbi:flagellar hook-length control protein FliK [Porticoccus sp.]
MDELQLTLTSTRVDQKNFGLWLKSWRVGQVLQALVTDKAPSGALVLRIAGHQITATADIPVQKGAQLMLEVSKLSPQPTLKILPQSTAASEFKSTLLPTPFKNLPFQQSDVAVPFKILLAPERGVNSLAFSSVSGVNLAMLRAVVRQFDALGNPEILKQAIKFSGLFAARGGSSLLLGKADGADLKQLLLTLLGDTVFRQQQSVSEDLGLEMNMQLENFKKSVEGALARITLSQYRSSLQGESGMLSWVFELPVIVGDDVRSLFVAIDQHNTRSEDELRASWKVWLSVDMPKLGVVEAELYFGGDKVSVVMYAAAARTHMFIEEQLAQLRAAFMSRGIDVGVLHCRLGGTGRTLEHEIGVHCVDENI